MLPPGFKIEIEDAALAWQDVTESVQSLTDGTSSEGQIVPTITLVFAADVDGLGALLDPEVNRSRSRLRVTDGALITWWLLEGHDGSVRKNLRYPVIQGRAAAGRCVDFRPLSYEWPFDLLASQIAQQACVQDVAGQSGAVVPVRWLASLDPTIPGKRYRVAKKNRLEIVREIAAACAASVRVSADGQALEVYDRPARALTAAAVLDFADALSLSYRMERIDAPANAVRVQGEVADYTRPTLPRLEVEIIPPYIDADGVSTAIARARVFDGSGRAVQHQAVIDEAIAAGSYTEIPVSGCTSVQGVWANSGTQEEPAKGARIEPTSFTASAITVPTQASQLFIVSYTRAEAVSWSLADYQDRIDGEAQASTGALAVSTAQPIGRVRGVYRASDTNRTGTDFYTGGSATPNTTAITLGISPGAAGTALIIDYDKYHGLPVVASLSPSSSLCDAGGFAETAIGAGETVGTAVVTASALGQEGSGELSLIGTDVGSLTVTIDPAVLRARAGEVGSPELVIDEACTVAIDTDSGQSHRYVPVDRKVLGVQSVVIDGQPQSVAWWSNPAEDDHRIYLNGGGYGSAGALASYTSIVGEVESDQTATITAVVLDAAGAPVSDGTPVKFELLGQTAGAELDAYTGYTTDGECEVTLTAGGIAEFTVRVTAGPYHYDGPVRVVENPSAEEEGAETGSGTIIWPRRTRCGTNFVANAEDKCCREVLKDYVGFDGKVCGRRRLIGCEGEPLAGVKISICNKEILVETDDDGWFSFCCGEEGQNTGVALLNGELKEISWTIDPAGSETRGLPGRFFSEGCASPEADT